LAPHSWFAGVTQTRVSHHDANMELNKPLEFRTLLWYPGVIRMHAKHHPQEEHFLRMQLYVRYCLEWWAVLWRSKNCRLCEQRNIQIGNMQCIINMINEMIHAKLHFGYCQELGKVMLVCVFVLFVQSTIQTLQMDVETIDLVVPLAHSLRLHVVNGSPTL